MTNNIQPLDIKNKVSCRDIATQAGIKLTGNSGICPVCKKGENTPCFSLYDNDQKAKCFSCGFSGDCIAIYATAKGIDNGAAIRELGEQLGLSSKRPQERLEATYRYLGATGELAYTIERWRTQSGGKRFLPKQPNGTAKLPREKRILYRLNEIITADTIYMVEGEKCADHLAKEGLAATTIPFGSNGKWEPQYDTALIGKNVYVLPDNDAPGMKHAIKVANAIKPHARLVTIVILPDLPPAGDVVDFLSNGGSIR